MSDNDSENTLKDSAIVRIDVNSVNDTPNITITSPADGENYILHLENEIFISADVSDIDKNRTIDVVNFYFNDILISSDTSTPYEYTLDISEEETEGELDKEEEY